MRPSRFLLLLSCLALLTACAGGNGDYQSYLARRGVPAPALQDIPHCRGYGCRHIDLVTLTSRDWREIAKPFRRAKDAQAERAALKPAMGLFEKKVGRLTGTDADRAGTYVKWGDDQHDCVDESVNTTVYLSLLQQKKLLRFHDIGVPASRLPLLGGGFGPHQTAVIIDRDTGERFAVDTWFYDNGAPAEVVPLDDWFYGWRPER